jgi:CBS domain-containing protein
MQAKDVMTARLELVNRRASLRDAARKMRDLSIGSLPVVDKGGQLVGMVTDRDIAIRGVAEGLSPLEGTVADVMTPDVITCLDIEDLKAVVELMEGKGIRRLVVVNDRRKPVGLLSVDDLAIRTGEQGLVAEVLQGSQLHRDDGLARH